MSDQDRAKLQAFIKRAGFTYGWLNLESWARRMAERAVFELDQVESHEPLYNELRDIIANGDDLTHEQAVTELRRLCEARWAEHADMWLILGVAIGAAGTLLLGWVLR